MTKEITLTKTAEGRINIPKNIVESIGAKAGDSLSIYTTTSPTRALKFGIRRPCKLNRRQEWYHTFVVSQDGRLRITCPTARPMLTIQIDKRNECLRLS